MKDTLRRIGRIFVLLVFVVSLFSYQGQSLAASGGTVQAAAPKSPNGLGAPNENSINFSGGPPGGLINNSHVAVAYTPALNPSGGSITIEAWVKRVSTSACETIVGNNYTISYWLGFCSPAGHVRFYSHGSGSSNDSAGTVPANVWTHVAVTYNGGTTKFYINGLLDTTTTANSGPISPASNGQELDIGADQDPDGANTGGAYFFNGNVEEVRIWSMIRTQAQIQGSLFTILGGSRPNLLAEWPLGGDLKDYSGGHDASAVTTADFNLDGAIPHDIHIPQIALGSPPKLDGSCDTQNEYASAVQVDLGGATAYLMHTATDMWVCVTGLANPTTPPDNWVAVYLDVNHTRLDPSQPNHYSLEVHDNNTMRTRLGDGAGNYAVTTTLKGQWSGVYVDCCGEFPSRSAEFKISIGLLGGWSHVIGLALAQHWITGVGDDRLWPALAGWDSPSTWSNATLGGIGPTRTYTGRVVYQPRTSPSLLGIPGVKINLIGSDTSGSEGLADTATSSLDGTFSLTSNDDFALHRLILDSSSIPQGYTPASASTQTPGVVINLETINFGTAPGGTYPKNIFTLGDPKPYVVDTQNGDLFLIVAPQTMINDGILSDFVDFKFRLGFQVDVESVESINSTYSDPDIGAKIRHLEKDRLAAFGGRFRYVLLVGPNSVIPHRFFAPYNENISDCTPGSGLPTDWYYADLNSNFDSNGNGCLADGIWGDPTKRGAGYHPDTGIAFNPNVSVGRLPYTSESAVTQALSDILGFEEQGNNFKRNTMLAASMMDNVGQCWVPANYPSGSYTNVNCDHLGTTSTDGSYLAEAMKSGFLNGDAYSSSAFYENTHPATGHSPAHIISPLPNLNTNLINAENSSAFGMINLTGHGNGGGVARITWTQDANGDNIIEAPTSPSSANPNSYEWAWNDLMSNGDLYSLTPRNGNGAVFITASCSTGDYTDPNSFGATALSEGNGVAWVGGLATVQYYGNWTTVNNGPYGGMEDMDYFVSQRLLDRNLRVGDAFWQAMKQYLANGNTDFSGIDYDLYGDPTMSYWGNPGQQSTLASWPMLRNNAFGEGYEGLAGPGVPTQLWSYAGGAPIDGSMAPSPVVTNDGEVVVAESNHVDVLWNGSLFQQLNLDAQAYGTPAIAADGSIYVLDVNGKLYDFDYGTLFFCFGGSCKGGIISPWRTRRWTYALDNTPLTSPIIGSDGMVAVAKTGGNFFGIIFSNVDMIRPDGVLFREEPIFGNAIGALAISADQKVYASTTTGVLVKMDFYCSTYTCKSDDGNGTLTETPNTTPPLLANGTIYVGRADGTVVQKNLSLGLMNTFHADSTITAGPVEGPDGEILVGTQAGTLYSLFSNLSLHWARGIGAPVTSVPAFSNDAVYIANGGYLRAYDPYSGNPLWLAFVGTGSGAGSAAVGYGREVYIQASNGLVQAWGEGWAHRPWWVSVSPIILGSGVDAHSALLVQFAYDPPLPPGQTVVKPQAGYRLNVAPPTGFLLQRSANGGDWVDIATLPPEAVSTGTVSFTDVSALPGVTYAYRVQALEADGNNSDFNTSVAVQNDPSLPANPVFDNATGIGAQLIDLAWHEDAASVVNAFRIERSPHGANTYAAIAVTSGETYSYSDEDPALTPITAYDYRLIAMNLTGNSGPSNVLNATTHSRNLAAPTNVVASLTPDGKVLITWTPGPAGETAVLQVNPQGVNGYGPLGTAAANAGSFTYDPGVPNNFGYRIKFVQGTDESAFTNANLRVNTHGFVGMFKVFNFLPITNK